jgi:hypothetical protein
LCRLFKRAFLRVQREVKCSALIWDLINTDSKSGGV